MPRDTVYYFLRVVTREGQKGRITLSVFVADGRVRHAAVRLPLLDCRERASYHLSCGNVVRLEFFRRGQTYEQAVTPRTLPRLPGTNTRLPRSCCFANDGALLPSLGTGKAGSDLLLPLERSSASAA